VKKQMSGAIKMGLATAAFAVVHSVLASQRAKKSAARWLGKGESDAFYRLFYIVQSLVTFGLLLWYGVSLPGRVLYEVRGPLVLLLRAGQALGLAHALYAAYHGGIARLLGLTQLSAWRRGGPIPSGPVAQGPERNSSSRLNIGGPYYWSRHPLNFSPLPVFWLTPRMTTQRLVFNVVATLYLVLGSLHEEKRLRAAYGEAYAAYQQSGIPFYWPRFRRLS
jgi:protein-S-isoprenylcysteine O-methyltransferase Ste14